MAGSGSAASTWQGLCREPRGIQRLPTGLDAWSHHIIRLGRVSIVLLAPLPGSVLHKHPSIKTSRPDSMSPTQEKQRAWHSGSHTSGKCMTLHARTTMIHDTRRQSVDDKVHRNSTCSPQVNHARTTSHHFILWLLQTATDVLRKSPSLLYGNTLSQHIKSCKR